MMRSPLRATALFIAGMIAILSGCGGGFFRRPRDLEGLLARARIEHMWNSPREATRYADLAAELPGASIAGRVRAYRFSAEVRAYVGDQSGAQKKLEQALALNPYDAETLAQLAANSRDNPSLAAIYAQRAVRAAEGAPSFQRAAISRLRGEILLDMEDGEGAERELLAALALVPEDLETLRLLVRAERGQRPAAVERARAADSAALQVPEWLRPSALRFAARVWLDLDGYAEAAADYRRALAIEPDDQFALQGLVQIAWKRPEAGLARLDVGATAVRAAPVEPLWTNWTAELLANAERHNPEGIEALRLRSAMAREKGRRRDIVEAVVRCAEAVRHAPLWQQAAGERLVARIQMDLGNEKDAEISLARSLRMEPNSLQTWLMLSSLQSARRSPRSGPSYATNVALGYRDIAEARSELGDEEGAERARKRAAAAKP